MRSHFEYPSIKNLTNNDIIEARSRETLFKVNEKIHGANFSLCFTEGDVYACSRNVVLDDDAKFFNHQDILEKYKSDLLIIKDFFPEAKDVRIFGELAGGDIQKNADYGDIDFYLFDIFVNFNRLDIVKMGHTLFKAREKGFKIKTTPNFGVMTIDQVIAYGNKFDNYINGKSICEGLILRDMSNRETIFKYKNDLFSEVKIDTSKIQKYHSYNTVNRAYNVISKMGYFNKKAMGIYINNIKEDIIKDMKQDGLEVDFDGKENKYISNVIMISYGDVFDED